VLQVGFGKLGMCARRAWDAYVSGSSSLQAWVERVWSCYAAIRRPEKEQERRTWRDGYILCVVGVSGAKVERGSSYL
jgi:hypothetical protein